MMYDEVRKKIKTGDLLFYTNPSFMGALVRSHTKHHVDHVGIAIRFGGRLWLLHSLPGKGPHLMLLSQRIPTEIIPSNCEITEDALNFAFSKLNLKYSLVDAVRAGFGRRTNSKGYICSEYVADILRKCGAVIDEWGTTPGLLYDQFLPNGRVIVDDAHIG